ncbi:20487_t:CDS:2, partial [Racocetra persica]
SEYKLLDIMKTTKQRRKRLTRERQQNFKKRRNVNGTETRVEVENTNVPEMIQNNNIIELVDLELPIIINEINSQAVENNGECFFVDGSDNTRKLFLYNILLAYIRSLEEIAVAVVSALLISSGHTAYSQFKIHLNQINLQSVIFYVKTDNNDENQRQRQFANFLLKIEESKYSVIPGTEDKIELPLNIAMSREKLQDLIDFVYPNLVKNSSDVNYIVSRAILIPKNDDIENISSMIIDQFSSKIHIYPSTDNMSLIKNSNAEQPQIYLPKFLRSLKISGLSSSELNLK